MARSDLILDEFLPYRLSVASNLVSDAIAGSYQALFGLKIPEWRLLAVIAETEGATQLAIGQRTRMDKVTVSRAALAMQARGLVQRLPNHQDGRSHLLELSAAGKALYHQVVPQALALERAIFEGLSAEEIRGLTSVLDRIGAAAEAVLSEGRG